MFKVIAVNLETGEIEHAMVESPIGPGHGWGDMSRASLFESKDEAAKAYKKSRPRAAFRYGREFKVVKA